MTVAGMMEATKALKTQLQALRGDSQFDLVFHKFEVKTNEFELEKLTLPRTKNPARISGQAKAFHPTNVQDYFRIKYLKMINVAIQQLNDWLLDCPRLVHLCELEAILLFRKIDEELISYYPELAAEGYSFQTQLDKFHSLLAKGTLRVVTTVTLDTCKKAPTGMTPAMRAMFQHVEALFRLLLVNPASSASTERSSAP